MPCGKTQMSPGLIDGDDLISLIEKYLYGSSAQITIGAGNENSLLHEARFEGETLFRQQHFQHFIRYQLVAGVIQMDPVDRQDPGFLVPGVVLEFVIVEYLAQIDQTAMELLCEITDHLRVGIEVSILPVGEIRPFADDGRGAKDGPDMPVQQLVDDRCIELLELVDIGSRAKQRLMPDIVDADIDEHDVRVLGENIVVHAQVKIVYLISADTRSDKGVSVGKVLLGKRLGHFHDVTPRLCALFGNGITKKDHFLRFAVERTQEAGNGKQRK